METKAATTQLANTEIPKNVRVFADSKKLVIIIRDGWFQQMPLEELARAFGASVWSPQGNPSIRRVYFFSTPLNRHRQPDYCRSAWIQENKLGKNEVHFVFTDDVPSDEIVDYIVTVEEEIYSLIEIAKS